MESLADIDGVILDGLTFCARVYALFERVRQGPDGPARLTERTSRVEKRLLEELLPICKYVQFYYRAGRYLSVRWVDGNQSFDAEIYQSGVLVDQGYYPATGFIEISAAMHENEHWIRKLLSEGRPAFAPEGITKLRGKPVVSEPVVFSNLERIHGFVPIILNRLSAKAAIVYPDNTSLIIECTLNGLYSPEEWRALVDEVQRRLPAHQFREILIFEGVLEHVAALV